MPGLDVVGGDGTESAAANINLIDAPPHWCRDAASVPVGVRSTTRYNRSVWSVSTGSDGAQPCFSSDLDEKNKKNKKAATEARAQMYKFVRAARDGKLPPQSEVVALLSSPAGLLGVPKAIAAYVIFVMYDVAMDRRERKQLLHFCCDLLQEQSVTEFLPLSLHDLLARVIQIVPKEFRLRIEVVNSSPQYKELRERLQRIGCQTLYDVLNATASLPEGQAWNDCTCAMLQHLCNRLHYIGPKLDQQATAAATPIPGSYNPVVNLEAYYFEPTGQRLRVMPRYPDLERGSKKYDGDDPPPAAMRCTKRNPSSILSCRMFFVFCVRHGHCWGNVTVHYGATDLL